MRNSFLLVALLFFGIAHSQEKPIKRKLKDSTLLSQKKETRPENHQNKKAKEETAIEDYKIISFKKDTTYFDTTLTIQKEYKYNYLRKDDFELLPFSNLGQTYNSLTYNFNHEGLYPQMGVRAKHFNYMEKQDIKYYHVPTPITDLFFKTAMEQGQLLDAFITLNTSERFNFSIAYKGLRSLGKYQNILTSTGNFRLTTNYKSKNNNYNLRAHIVTQDLLNEENGGITTISQFEDGSDEFRDRSRIDVNFENAENTLVGKRYFLDHELLLVQKNDSISNYKLALGHQFNYETKFYQFTQTTATDYFADAFQASNLRDRAQLQTLFNQLHVNYQSKSLGNLQFKTNHYHYNYFFKSIVITESGVITNKLNGNEIAIGGSWKHDIAGITLEADAMTNISGNLGGNYIKAAATYTFNDDASIKAAITTHSKTPNFNFLLYQSDYINYNWQNDTAFEKENTQNLNIQLNSKKWLNASFNYTILDNHAYFGEVPPEVVGENEQAQPFQYTNSIQYINLKLNREFTFGKFALNNTLMFQNVSQQDDVLNVPQWITRNTFYFSDYIFDKAMYLQTGITLKYFSSYYANAYSPLLGEFYTQNQQEIGGFPLIDFFINAKVRQTRIYLKAEHFNSDFTNYNYYSAPNYPYKDFIVRFGLVWNFFL